MIKLGEFLSYMEFSYKINDDDTISLVDELSANLGNIEEEKYTIDKYLASFLVERLDAYIYDYHVSGIIDTLRHECQYKDDVYPYDEKLIPAMKQYKEVFGDSLIEYMEDIVNANIDISEVVESKKIKKKCFRCGTRLMKSQVEGYTYFCHNCNEDFCSFEQGG